MTTPTEQERPAYQSMGDDETAFRFGPEVDVPDGEHSATLVDLGTMLVVWDNEERERVRWDFGLSELVTEEGAAITVSGWTSRSTGEKSTARRWLAALLGADGIANGATIRKADLTGRPCRIVVVHDDKGYPKVDLVLSPKARA